MTKPTPRDRREALELIRPTSVSVGMAKRIDRTFRHYESPTQLFTALAPRVELPTQDPKAPPARPMTRLERERFSAELFHGLSLPEPSFDDLTPERALVVWRITRELARWRDLAGDDELLTEATCPDRDTLDPWTSPAPYKIGARTAWYVAGLPDLPVPLLPPPPPLDDPERPPHSDQFLQAFLAGALNASRVLGISDTPLGVRGLRGLLDHDLTRFVWPDRFTILFQEEALIEHTIDLLLEVPKNSSGDRTVSRTLQEEFGLRPHESACLKRLAKRTLFERHDIDVDQERVLMVARLEGYVRRCQESCDLKQEIQGLKQLGQVLGLTRTEVNDLASDFMDVVATISNEGPDDYERRLLSHAPKEITVRPESP